MGTLDGKTAIVTGSSRGIGREIALGFAEEGADVVTNAPTEEEAATVATEITEQGENALAVGADVTDREAVSNLVDRAVERFGGLDVMVNNAGVSSIAPVLELDSDEWQRVLDVNLTGVFYGAQAAGRWFAENEPDDGGQIINISSIFGQGGVQGRAAYNASKGGVNNLTRCLAIELAEHDICVNAIAPGFVRTSLDEQTRAGTNTESDDAESSTGDWPYYDYEDQHIENRTPLGRFGSPAEIARCAVFLAAGENYVTGEILHADGGWSAFGWGSKGH